MIDASRPYLACPTMRGGCVPAVPLGRRPPSLAAPHNLCVQIRPFPANRT